MCTVKFICCFCGLLVVEGTSFNKKEKWENGTDLSEHPDMEVHGKANKKEEWQNSTDLSEHPDMEVRGKVCL